MTTDENTGTDAGTDTGRYDDRGEVPLAGYATLASVFAAGTGGFALLARRRGVRPPERMPPWDVVLLGTATYKASRLLTRDKVTSFVRAPFTRRSGEGEANEVMDVPRGGGLRRAVGDLLSCPFCVSAWVAGTLVCSYAAAPRLTRLVCGGFGAVAVSDWLQYAWTWTQQTEDA
ncbi:DUF1360 domain-containing protein [Streptomyces misionensis]|uniref:DUF1360 domain-containing protein n=1 Tax=Streptomyces misionensis TaxID=67331 RepID=UPI0034202785